MNEHTKNVLDIGSGGVAIGTLMGIMPKLAALASLIWTLIRIGEWGVEKWRNYSRRSSSSSSSPTGGSPSERP